MTGRNRALFLIPLLTVFTGSEISRDRPQHGKHGLVITGTAIGYDELAPLANLTSAPHIDILIVRVALNRGTRVASCPPSKSRRSFENDR